jgi:hypothetical protein
MLRIKYDQPMARAAQPITIAVSDKINRVRVEWRYFKVFSEANALKIWVNFGICTNAKIKSVHANVTKILPTQTWKETTYATAVTYGQVSFFCEETV